MSVDASAVARVLGITTTYEDLRAGGVLFLPQRIMVIAQGSTAASFSTTKREFTNAPAVGAAAGYGSPAHLVAKQLHPQNGDGVGTIPVTYYLLDDDAAGVAAAGDITPSGSQTRAASYRVAISNMLSRSFVIPVASSVTAVCRLAKEAVDAILDLPMLAAYTYGAVTAAPGGGNGGDGTCTVLSASGTPVPGGYTLECTGAVAHGGVFKLIDPDGDTIATGLTMTPGTGGATVIVNSGLTFTLTDGAADFEVGDTFAITVPATKVDLDAKWKGLSSNDLYIEVLGDALGTTFAITQPTGGLVNPEIDAALAQVGNVWESMGLNALNISDDDALDAIQTFGDGRWGTLVHKPMVFFTGNTATTVEDATAVSSARTDDKVNVQLVSPGSNDLPFVVAARQLARIAKVANNNPPRDYGSQRATGLTPGADGDQWDYPMRDAAVKAGSSTVEVRDGVVCLSDTVTFYAPEGEPTPGYRYVCDIVKLQNIIFNISLIFATEEWDGAPLIPDAQATVNPDARKPKSAVAEVCAMHDSLGLQAIISDVPFAKENTTAVLASDNAKRLNVRTKVKLSGNSNIVDVDLTYGLDYGTSVAA